MFFEKSCLSNTRRFELSTTLPLYSTASNTPLSLHPHLVSSKTLVAEVAEPDDDQIVVSGLQANYIDVSGLQSDYIDVPWR